MRLTETDILCPLNLPYISITSKLKLSWRRCLEFLSNQGDLVSVGEIYELKKMYDRLVQEEEEQQQQEGGGDEDVGEQVRA
jgi:hypothetical protein